MLSIDQALQAVLDHVAQPRVVRMPVAAAQGLSLAGGVVSTADSPPYDKSLMDGYAVVASDMRADPASGSVPAEIELLVQEEITAGRTPTQALVPGRMARIMTGAPLPDRTDAVVMLEETEPNGEQDGLTRVRLRPKVFRAEQNILRRGAAMRAGDKVLSTGDPMTPAAIGLLAELGIGEVEVYCPPTVTMLSTGDELVPFAAQPAAGQIRNSNGPMLAAQVRAEHALPQELGIARDNEEELRMAIERGLQADILLLSGGVSAGDLDLVPGVLQSLGVRQVFHKVHLKPGKPLWFGVANSEDEQPGTLVFGLPGNPVSSFVCFELFVRPAIRKLMGRSMLCRKTRWLPLAEAYRYKGGRPVYLPAKIESNDAGESGTGEQVRLLAWQGSADLRRLAEANALVQLAEAACEYAAGEEVRVLRLTAE